MAIQTKTMVVKSDTALAETKTTIRDTVTFDTSKLPNGITYKGLKAVLSFADPIQWNKASTYDSLTVVWDDATHASYASKRPVPQNIELTNEFYWFRTADLDAQVEMYRQEVKEFDGRITANAQAIAAETGRAEGAEQALAANIEKGLKKDCVFFGDSWVHSYYNVPTEVNSTGFFDNVYDFAVGGVNVFNMHEQITRATADERFQNSDIETVIVISGTNDVFYWNAHDDNSVYMEYGKFFSELRTAFPHAAIHWFPDNAATTNGGHSFRYGFLLNQASNYGVVGHEESLHYCAYLNGNGLYRGNDQVGVQHLSDTGYKFFSQFILSAIQGKTFSGMVSYAKDFNLVFTSDLDLTITKSAVILYQIGKLAVLKTVITVNANTPSTNPNCNFKVSLESNRIGANEIPFVLTDRPVFTPRTGLNSKDVILYASYNTYGIATEWGDTGKETKGTSGYNVTSLAQFSEGNDKITFDCYLPISIIYQN